MRAVNLIPADQRSNSGSLAGNSNGGAFIVLGLIGGLAILALLYGMAHHQISTKRSQVASLDTQAQAAQAQANQLAPYTSFMALRAARTQAVAQLVDSRFDWAHSFRELGRVLPHDTSLSAVQGAIAAGTGTGSASVATPSSSVSSATPPGSAPTFTLSGCSISQSEVAETLQRLRLIDGVSDVHLQSSTKGSSSAASASAPGGCPSGAAVFTVQVTFDALPSLPATDTSTPAGSAAPASTGTTPSTGATPGAAQ
jgi:Tfp pilus assembly protein PilN